MNTRYPLTATIRDIVGHKSRNLSKKGDIPATIYGRGRESIIASVTKEAFLSVYKKAGETHIVDLSINGKTLPVLIHNIQIQPVSKKVLHIEFLTVNLTEKLKTFVQISLIGESPAVTDKKGILLTTLQEIEIETLPTNIPETIPVDVSTLAEVDQEIKVNQLVIPSGVTVLADPELTVVKVGAIVIEEAPEPTIEEASKESEATTSETAKENTDNSTDQA